MKWDTTIIYITQFSRANVLPYITCSLDVSTLQEEPYYYLNPVYG